MTTTTSSEEIGPSDTMAADSVDPALELKSAEEVNRPVDPKRRADADFELARAVGAMPGESSALPDTSTVMIETSISASAKQEADALPEHDPLPLAGGPARIRSGGSSVDSRVELLAAIAGNPDAIVDRADSVLDAGVVGQLEVRAASVRGYGHRWSQPGNPSTTRQDEYSLGLSADRRWLLVAVADGVSSGARSHRAAQIATRGAVRAMKASQSDRADEGNLVPLDDRLSALLHEHLTTEIAAASARELGIELVEGDLIDAELMRTLSTAMATTLVVGVVAVTPDGVGTHSAAVAVVAGDSAAWKLRESSWVPLGAIKNADAEIADAATAALPALTPEALAITSLQLASGEALVLLTDGVGDPLGNGETEFGRFLANAWRTPPDKWEFGQQIDSHIPGHGDDRTAVVIWPQP